MVRFVVLIIFWLVLIINNPLILSLLFVQALVMLSFYLGSITKFLGSILFLVYVGGIIVLLAYCVILLPSSKYSVSAVWPATPAVLFLSSPFLPHQSVTSFNCGLIYRSYAILLVALLLYLVILAIVNIIDYAGGILKLYVSYNAIQYALFILMFPLVIIIIT